MQLPFEMETGRLICGNLKSSKLTRLKKDIGYLAVYEISTGMAIPPSKREERKYDNSQVRN
jgi:hypothetical protein